MALSVSIITPALVKDREALSWLTEAIASVDGQSARDRLEMIVVNDRSPVPLDGVRDRFPWVRFADAAGRGVSDARNQAAEMARAPLLLPLDADDKLAPRAVDLFLGAWARRGNCGVIYSDVVAFGRDFARVYLAPDFSFDKLLHATFMSVGCLHERASWERVGGWRRDMTGGLEDWEYWIALAELGICGKHLPEPLYFYRRHALGRLAWLRGGGAERFRESYARMRDLHIDSYNGKRSTTMGCCGGGRAPAPAPRSKEAMIATSGLVTMVYVGARIGSFMTLGGVTRTRYFISGQGELVKIQESGQTGVKEADVQWFRSVNGGRDFRIVEAPAAPRPAPRPAPAAAQTEGWSEAPNEDSFGMADTVGDEIVSIADAADVDATDAAREHAEELGVDLSTVRGTGAGGRILVKDVRDAAGAD